MPKVKTGTAEITCYEAGRKLVRDLALDRSAESVGVILVKACKDGLLQHRTKEMGSRTMRIVYYNHVLNFWKAYYGER